MASRARSKSRAKSGIGYVLRRTLGDFWSEMFLILGANVLWLIVSLPVVTMPPATAGLFAVTNKMAHGRASGLGYFWEGFKAYFAQSWKLVAVNAVIPILTIVDFAFYAGSDNPLIMVVRGVWLFVFLLWLSVQPYLFPLMFEQVDTRLQVLVRNAVLLAFSNPLFTLVPLLITVAVLFVSLLVFQPLVLVAAGFLSLLYNHATVARLRPLRAEDPDEIDGD